jgi:hydrolase, TatD family
MQFIDTHSHLYSAEFAQDLDSCVKRAKENGVTKILLPNIDDDSIEEVLNLCNKYDCFYPMIGLHPTELKADYEKQLSKIESYFEITKFYAIGEIGLDYYWDKSNMEAQIKVFERQILWAINRSLPLVLHIRKAVDEAIKILRTFQKQKGIKTYNGIFHCFSGDERQAKEAIEMGFKLGVGGVVTFNNVKMAQIVNQTDLSNIVLETDCPYLTPVPYRGKRNESAYIPIIAQKVAELKNITIEEVSTITTLTAQNVFGL